MYMTKDELQELLQELGLDYEAEANQVYVFYVTRDGLVHNFSLNVRRGTGMSDDEVVGLMRSEYPSTREGRVLTVERPVGGEHNARAVEYDEWLDVSDACRLLKIGRATLYRWMSRGVFHASHVGSRTYFSRSEIERILRENIIQENGRIDGSCRI